MVNVKGKRMFESSLFSISFFCFFLLAPPKKVKDVGSKEKYQFLHSVSVQLSSVAQ